METAQKLPRDLEKYISERSNDIHDGNAAEHRPTHRTEIDRMINNSVQLYEAGQELIKSLTPEEIGHCTQLYMRKNQYRSYELVEVRLLGKRVIVPRYITYIEEARELAKIFAK